MRRLAIAGLGSAGFLDESEFIKRDERRHSQDVSIDLPRGRGVQKDETKKASGLISLPAAKQRLNQ